MNKISRQDFLGRSYESYSDAYDMHVNNPSTVWIENSIPVHPMLKKLYDEFKHKNPMARPGLAINPAYVGPSEGLYHQMNIVFADATDISRGVMYVEANSNAEWVYAVKSPLIRNERYSAHNNDYHVKRSKDFRKAKATALDYIKPVQIDEIMGESKYSLQKAKEAINYKAMREVNKAMEIDWKSIHAEVLNMMNAGYVPTTQKFNVAVDFMRENGTELVRLADYNPIKCFVWAKPDHVTYKIDDGEPRVARTLEEIPEEIRDKLSVLQIANKHEAIVDVGIRVDDTKFWVFL